MLRDKVRMDGRGLSDIRTLSAEVDVIPRVHGSALFERGETQILGVTTLNMLTLEQKLDTLSPEKTRRYMHKYVFPPFSTGETGRVGSPKRREVGHGALARRALLPVLPTREEFPYAIRQLSEAMGSNGSTSMGSVCASTMSLLQAGVPLKAPVAGIAMGLISDEVDGKTEYVALTDILGAEDAFGDMDFKVAGTREFVTALQLDTKLDGIPAEVLGAALGQAKDARLAILDVMAEAIDAPAEMSLNAPRIITVKIPVDKIGEVIGPKGKVINQIQDDTGAADHIEDDGTIYIGATNGESAEAARSAINAIANPTMPEVGERYLGTVVKTTNFGAFVSLLPGKDGLLHISKLRSLAGGKRVEAVEDVVSVGQKVQVQIAEIDDRGKLSLVPVVDGLRARRGARRVTVVAAGSTTEAWHDPHAARREGRGGTVVSTVRRTVLPGGLRVVTEAMPGVRSASIGVWVGVGSRDESPTLSGASHFLEHLLFQGTPTRSALDISVSLDEVGGEFNAFTAKEYTCFHARVLDVDLPLAVDVLGDMITSSTIATEDVEAEREVILDEIAMHDDDPEDVVTNVYAEKSWRSSPLGRPIAGTADSIRALTRAQIRRYYRPRYRPENMVVAVAGNVEHAAVVRQVRKAFSRGGFLTDTTVSPLPVRAASRARRTASGDVVVARPFEQVNLLLGFNGLARTDDRRYALGVLNAALGGGTSSRLFQEVRERRGLAYSVYSFAPHYSDAGAFAVAARLPARQAHRGAGRGAQRAAAARRRRHHRGGAAARPGPAARRAGARARGLRLADVADRQGRAALRRAAEHRHDPPAGRGRDPRRRPHAGPRPVHAAADAGRRRAVRHAPRPDPSPRALPRDGRRRQRVGDRLLDRPLPAGGTGAGPRVVARAVPAPR